MKVEDQSNDGAVGTMVGETYVPSAAVERMHEGRSSKGKATKKAKAKLAKKNGAVEDRFDPVPASEEERVDSLAPVVVAAADGGGRQPEGRVLEEEPVTEGNESGGQLSVETGPGQVPGSEAGASGEPAPAASSRRRWMRSNTTLVCGCILVAALSVALVLSLLALSNQDAQASSGTSALATARTYAVQLASYNYRDLNGNFATVAAESTPSFRRSFTESSDALKSTLSKYKATAEASVVSAGLVSSGTSHAVALVFLTQKIANSTQAKPTTDRSQVQISLVRSGGRWLINQVTLL